MRLAGYDSQTALRQEPRDSLGPFTPNERVLVAVDDKSPLLDEGQPILDAIGEDGAGTREQRSNPGRPIVAGHQREQGKRLASRGLKRAHQLTAGGAASGIDSRADQHHGSNLRWPARGELGNDLTAHRIRDERRACQILCLDPRA